jgi:hypothetical protein
LIQRILQEINTQSNARIIFMNQPLRFRGLVSNLNADAAAAWRWVQHFPFLHLTPLIGLSPQSINQISNKLHTPVHLVSFNNWEWVDEIEEFSLASTITNEITHSMFEIHPKIKESNFILSERFESWITSPEINTIIDQILKDRRLELVEEKLLSNI